MKKKLSVSVKSFIVSIAILLVLVIGTYIATLFIPAGEFARVIDPSTGKEIIDVNNFSYVTRDFPVWKFFLSPFLIFTSKDSLTIIEILIFLFLVAGSMASLIKTGIMDYFVKKLSAKFKNKRYLCLAIIILFFMLMGAFVGSFEEVIPFVPIIVSLMVGLGFDTFTGFAACLVATSCGFASGVMNPFTVGIAQNIAGLPMFSGIWLRILAFVLIYFLLVGFLVIYNKIREKKSGNVEIIRSQNEEIVFEKDPHFEKAILAFAIIMATGIALTISSSFIPAIRDYTIIFMAVAFLTSGIVCPLIVNKDFKSLCKNFLKGIIDMLPAVLMIMLASSIKYILTETKSLDTVLKGVLDLTKDVSPLAIVLIIYLEVLILNFFIPSGSAKAFLIMPLILPLATVKNVSLQLCVLAFAFGDGFSNVVYPSNPVLLIGLNLVNEPYSKYIKRISIFEVLVLILTTGLLVFGFAVGY